MPLDRWLLAAMVALNAVWGVRAWRRGDRAVAVDASVLIVAFLAIIPPGGSTGVRYSVAGVALLTVMARHVHRDFFRPGRGRLDRALTAGVVVFVLSMAPALVLEPAPKWAAWLVLAGAVAFFAPLVSFLFWISRLMFAARRLKRDLHAGRPPRTNDERTLGIDLSVLRGRRRDPDAP